MLGVRSRSFYRALKGISNVVSIPPVVLSHDACVLADVVLIGGGSIGIESYVRGNAIASFCDTTYWYAPSGARFLDLSDISSWTPILLQLIEDHQIPSDQARLDFVKACLSTTIRQRKRGIVWPIPNSDDLALLFEKTDNTRPY